MQMLMTDDRTSTRIHEIPVSEQAPVPEPAALGGSPSRRRLSRPVVNLVLDSGLLLVFVTLLIVSVILQFVFPPGIAARGWVLWGLNHSRWSSLQFFILCVFSLGIVVHVMLHWTWVCGVIVRQLLKGNTLPDDGIRTLAGVGLLIAMLLSGAFVTGAAILSIETPDDLIPLIHPTEEFEHD